MELPIVKESDRWWCGLAKLDVIGCCDILAVLPGCCQCCKQQDNEVEAHGISRVQNNESCENVDELVSRTGPYRKDDLYELTFGREESWPSMSEG